MSCSEENVTQYQERQHCTRRHLHKWRLDKVQHAGLLGHGIGICPGGKDSLIVSSYKSPEVVYVPFRTQDCSPR